MKKQTKRSIGRLLAWAMSASLTLGNISQVSALTLAQTPLAASTTSVVRPNLMYVLDDSGSMAWDYTPDYINDASITDPTNPGLTPPGSSGDIGQVTVTAGAITAITALGGNVYGQGTPTVLIQGAGTGAAATVTLNATTKKIQSVNVTSGGTGYTAGTTYVAFIGGLSSSAWGMCWGTTGASNQGGSPKDTSAAPVCNTNTQPPYAAAPINYQYYDPAIRYLPPLNADGSSYPSASTTAAKSDGFSGAGSLNLTTSWPHEVWCNTASPSPTPSASNIATHPQCKENLDTTGDNLYPNVTYTFRKTYNGPATYYTMDASEFCTDTNYTQCITRAQALAAVPAFQVGGVVYNVPSKYRWCSYYNPRSRTFGGCQGRRDLDHYIPNYLGGWVSTGAAGVQATAELIIGTTVKDQSLTGLTVGGSDIVNGTTFTSIADGDEATVADLICQAIIANTGSTGYTCARTGSKLLIQASVVGTAANGLPVLATGPTDVAAVNATGEIRVTTATAGLQISSITINGNELIAANVTADGNQGNTAAMICDAINSGPNVGVYIARSGLQATIAADGIAFGTCNVSADAYLQIKRIPADATDNGQAIVISGPAAATLNTGSILITPTTGATNITDVTLGGVSIMSPKPLAIADGTQTTTIAATLAARLTGNGGCTATASGSTITLTGATCTGALVVTSPSTLSTATMKVTSTTKTNGANLGGIQVNGTSLAGAITSSTLTNGTAVSANATSLRTAINAGTGTHGFSAAAPTLSGSDYNMVVTAPAGTAFNGQSFTFQAGSAVAAGSATSPTWNFTITNATANDAVLEYIRCDASDTTSGDEIYPLSTDADTGTASVATLQRTTNLADGLNANDINGYTFSCVRDAGTVDDQECSVTGPTGVSACTSNLVFTKAGTITTKNYSRTAAAAVACPAITAPSWTFKFGSLRSGGSDTVDRRVRSITCNGTNTVTPDAATTGTSTNNDNRRNNLDSELEASDINGFSYACANASGELTCVVTGPTSASCTNLVITTDSNMTLNSNAAKVQTCTAVSPANSATWYFELDTASADNALFDSITCNGTNTITTNTVSTGTTTSNAITWINNLASEIETNDQSGYTIDCTTATVGTPTSACTITGPAAANACQGTDTDDSNNCGVGTLSFKYNGNEDSSGIAISGTGITHPDSSGTWRSCLPATSNGSTAVSAVDNFAPYLFTVSAFSGGTPSQTTTITPMASSNVGPIGTATSAMVNGTPPSITAIATNATGSAPNVLTMAGGAAADPSTNNWNGVGIFKRVDIVPATTSYTRESGRTDCSGSTCTYSEELQNFANWYSYYRTRMLMMKSATTLAFSQLDGNYRVGYDNICDATTDVIDRPVAQFVGAARTNWWTSLTTESPSCATPLRAETAKIGRYYAGKLAGTDPLEYSCQQNYMILVTDGYWNESESNAIKGVTGADIGDKDNVLAVSGRPFYDGALASTCPAIGAGRGSTASSCRTLADIAWYFYSTDLRSVAFGNATNPAAVDVATNNVLTTADDKNQTQHMNFFAMGLGIEGKLAYTSDYQTAPIGDYADILAGTKNWPAVANLDPTGVDDLWHATVNGHGKYFSARNVPNVVAGLREALNKIGARVGSAAAAATSNLEPVAGDNFAYVASYATVDWTGDLQSRSIDVNTGDVSPDTACSTAGSGCQWSAQAKLDQMTWSVRRLFIKPVSGVSGDALRRFTFPNLTIAERAFFNPSSLSQYAALFVSNPFQITASNLVDFLRGNRGLEQDGNVSHAQIWRRRTHVFGDIVNTQPIFMKAPSNNYADSGYASFKTSGAAANRKPVVFVSAQDGYLHAINAHTSSQTVSASTVAPGEEMWAFMPTAVMPAIKTLADVNYAHRYFVDGQITIADVDFGGGDWHTILVGGQGAGGNSYYALDVTDPTDPKYLWEFTDPNLGNTFSNTTVSKLPNGEWVVLFTSGYNNTVSGGDGIGRLFALNPKTGAIKSGFPMSTGSGTGGDPSNLGKLAVWADNPGVDNTTQFVYAGDLQGDLWRFDFDPLATGHTGVEVFKLAHLENTSGIPQPITTKPELTTLENGARAVYVGTGKYLETSDLLDTTIHSFYAIKDTLGVDNLGNGTQETWNPVSDTVDLGSGSESVFLPRKLLDQDAANNPLTNTTNGVTRNIRLVCAGSGSSVTALAPHVCDGEDTRTMDWDLYGGWVVTFPDSGERMNVDPKLVLGTLVFATNVPAANSCTVGGSAWVNFLDFATGLAVDSADYSSLQITDSLVVGVTVVKLQTGEYKAIATKSNYQQETLSVPIAPATLTTVTPPTFQSRRGLWRELEVY
jgi:type IV pilus assembly protein PilY1